MRKSYFYLKTLILISRIIMTCGKYSIKRMTFVFYEEFLRRIIFENEGVANDLQTFRISIKVSIFSLGNGQTFIEWLIIVWLEGARWSELTY